MRKVCVCGGGGSLPSSSSFTSLEDFSLSSRRFLSIILLLSTAALSSALIVQPISLFLPHNGRVRVINSVSPFLCKDLYPSRPFLGRFPTPFQQLFWGDARLNFSPLAGGGAPG